MGRLVYTTAFSLALSAALGCGGEPPAPATPPPPNDDDACLNCDFAQSEDDTPAPRPSTDLSLSPTMLMFYGDTSTDEAPELLHYRAIRIENRGRLPVLITGVSVRDAPAAVGGVDGSAHFEALDVTGTLLDARDGRAELGVRFLGSTQQRSAMVQITTNHPGYPVLRVPVTGKLFEGFEW